MDNGKDLLAAYLWERFERYREGRKPFEERWEEAYYNTLGEYSPSVQGQWRGREASGSRIFVRITRHKVRQAVRHLEPVLRELRFDLLGGAGDEKALSAMKGEVRRVLELGRCADRLCDMLWDGAWSGTGILRAPVLAHGAEALYVSGGEGGGWDAACAKIPYPAVENVSIWNFYPDPDALGVEDGEGVIEMHRVYPHQMRAMVERAGWDKGSVERAIAEGDAAPQEGWERSVRSASGLGSLVTSEKLKVLEYWGVVPAELLAKAGVSVPKGARDVEAVLVVCGGRLLKCGLNPWNPAFRPYLRFRWEPVPHRFWGVGVAENIRDSQKMINGATRLFVDNKALAGNCMFELDAEALVPGQDLSTVYPGKKWVLRPGASGPAVRPVSVPDIGSVLIEMITLFSNFADETSGVSMTLDATGASSSATATGLSIAQSSALEGYRSTMRRLDDEIVEPLVERVYRWLMEYGPSGLPKAPAKVRAMAHTATQARELRSKRLMEFAELIGGPLGALPSTPDLATLAGRVDMGRILEGLADSLELREILRKGEEDGRA